MNPPGSGIPLDYETPRPRRRRGWLREHRRLIGLIVLLASGFTYFFRAFDYTPGVGRSPVAPFARVQIGGGVPPTPAATNSNSPTTKP
jgi:hypothetical protein